MVAPFTDAAITSRPDGAIGLYRVSEPKRCDKHQKKTKSSLGKQDCRVIPPEQNAEFVSQMGASRCKYISDIITDFPVVCLDEATKQLVQEIMEPVAVKPRQIPNGRITCMNVTVQQILFILCEPIMRMATYKGHRTANSS